MTELERAEYFGRIAPLMRELKEDPQAQIAFDLFAGGLVWTDEHPDFACIDGEPVAWRLRCLLHYRSSLILGKPSEKFRAAWDEAQRLFPTWPGFSPNRRDPSLKAEYERLSERAHASLDELDTKLSKRQVAT